MSVRGRGMNLSIDVEAERVQLGALELYGQWVDFYAALALVRTDRGDPLAFVSAEALARVGPWRHKAPASVGKEVARHLKQLARSGLDHALACHGRTRAWRIDIPPEDLRFSPDREAVRTWLQARSLGAQPGYDWLNDLRVLVKATATLQHGEAEAAQDLLEGLSKEAGSLEPALEAWSALLRGRAAFQHEDEDDELLSQLCEAWSRRTDGAGKAVGARLRTLLAIQHRFEDPEATLASLTKLATDLELRGDVGSLGAVENVIGLLVRRAGDPAAAASHHLRAIALCGITGDYPLMQAVLYNLALCRRESLALQGRPPDEEVLALVDLCRLACARFGVGSDSAQAEISGAQWSLEMGDMAQSRRYLEAAEALIKKLESTYDQACFLDARARIELAAPTGTSSPVRDLRTAEALFVQVGDQRSAAKIHRMVESLEQGRGPEAPSRHPEGRPPSRQLRCAPRR